MRQAQGIPCRREAEEPPMSASGGLVRIRGNGGGSKGEGKMMRSSSTRRFIMAAVGCLVAVCLAAPMADANLQFTHAGVKFTNPDGTYSRQAGGHPDFTFSWNLPTG